MCYRPFNPVTFLFWGLFTHFLFLNILMRSSPAHLRKSYTQEVWHGLLTAIEVKNPTNTAGLSTIDWWLLLRKHLLGAQQKGIDSAVMLVSWKIWKECNARVFNNRELTASQLMQEIFAEGDLWIQAGAGKLACIGWPCSSVTSRVPLPG